MPGGLPGIYRVPPTPRGTPVRGGDGGVGVVVLGKREAEREEGEMRPWPIHKQMNSLRL